MAQAMEVAHLPKLLEGYLNKETNTWLETLLNTELEGNLTLMNVNDNTALLTSALNL